MWTRRDALAAGAAAATACGCGAARAETIRLAPGTGCSVAPETLSALEREGRLSALRASVGARSYDLFRTSGDPSFDAVLGQVLGEVARTLDVFPAFRYYDDEEGPNARATPARLSGQAKGDGTVLFGARLLRRMRRERGGDSAVLVIAVHEFAHIMAYKRGLEPQLARDGLTRPHPRRRHCAFELHADFMAGWFARRYVERTGLDLTAAGRAWVGFGSAPSHGALAQRRASLNAGYALFDRRRRADADDAFEAATAHVRQYRDACPAA